MSNYNLFGWRVSSSLPLPELLPWLGEARAPDITIDVGEVPPEDNRLPSFSPAVQASSRGVRLAIPEVATYWIEAGSRVIVQPALSSDAPSVRVFLLGTVLAILCFQRGVLPLHASAVDIGGRVLLISGVSGAGKSTLAAAFSSNGYRLLSDDLCGLAARADQPLMVLPAFPRVKLWRDSAEQLSVPINGLEQIREGLEKFSIPLTKPRFQLEALPPALIVLLRVEHMPEQHQPRRLVGVEALRRFDLVHRWRLGLALGYHTLIFNTMARLIEAVPMMELARSNNLSDLPALVDRVRGLKEMQDGQACYTG